MGSGPSDDIYCITRSLEVTEMFLLWGRWLRGPPHVPVHTSACVAVGPE